MGGLTYKKVFKFAFIIFLLACFNQMVNGVPFSIALLPGLFSSGVSPLFLLISFFITCLFSFTFKNTLLLFASGLILCTVFSVYRRKKRQIRIEIVLFLIIALLPYAFGFDSGINTQKAIYSAVICILSIILSQGLNFVFVKKFNKKASSEQRIAFFVGCVCLLFGFINLTTVFTAYFFAVLILLCFCYFYKNTKAYTVALVVSLPFFLKTEQLNAVAIFIIYCAVTLLFINKSKLISCISVIITQTAYALLTGVFTAKPLTVLFYFAPFAVFLFLPSKVLDYFGSMVKKFDEPEMIRDIINDERALLSAKLYHLSSVFKNLNSVILNFNKLTLSRERLIQKICDEVIFTVCTECNYKDKCYKKNKPKKNDILKLVEIGINKGNINLIDLSRDFSSYCYSTNTIIFTINKLLDEYKLHLEKSDLVDRQKSLIAMQSEGVSEVLKNMAFEFSEKIYFNKKSELELFNYFASYGVPLKQIIALEKNYHLLFPNVKIDFALTTKLLSEKTNIPMRLNCKTEVEGGILAVYCPATQFDACFGVAQKTKQGSSVSGDTHSLTRIDENNFLIALCDGMGSGENAFLNSQTAISLIEAFFKAKLCKQTCVELANKMISLCSSDTFCALDLIAIDLEKRLASVIKIGASFGFLITKDGVKIIENNALPLGIMEEISPTCYTVNVKDGDTFVLLSDGITDAFFSSTDTVEFLEREKCANPQTLADKLLNYAINQNGGEPKDDMTAIVVRLYKKEFCDK